MTAKRKMTPEAWSEAEAMAMRGVSYKAIARHFGISHGSVRQRASREDWQTPDQIARKRSKAARLAREGVGEASAETGTGGNKGGGTLAVWTDRDALLAAAQRGPKAFGEALAAVARRTLAEGAAAIPVPRTIAELGRWVDILYKTSRLDAKVSGGDTRFIRSPSSLSRTVEAEEIPNNSVDGFKI